jgi:hypothetical protein
MFSKESQEVFGRMYGNRREPAKVYTQVYTVKVNTDHQSQGTIMPWRPFRGRLLLIRSTNLEQTFRMFAGNLCLFASPCPVHQFHMSYYSLILQHAFENNWDEERTGNALARFAIHAPTIEPGSQYMFEVEGLGEAEFMVIGDELPA